MAIIRVPKDQDLFDAIDDANPGDVILVAPGIYTGPFVITTSNIRIVSESKNRAIITTDACGVRFGLQLNRVTNVELFGFSIISFDDASLRIVGGGNHHILNNQFLGRSMNGLLIDSSMNNLIWNNEISGNTTGIQITGPSHDNWFIHNIINFNSSTGINLSGGDNNCFIENTFIGNLNGIISTTKNSLFHKNTISASNSGGLLLTNSGNNIITNNTSKLNSFGYVAMTNSPNNYFFKNLADGNSANGFSIMPSNDFPTLVNNQALNSGIGAAIGADFGNLNGNQFNNQTDGLDVSGNNNNIYFNSMQNNTQFDIQNSGSNNTFEGNQCTTSNPPGLC